jgi:tight adherence protein B
MLGQLACVLVGMVGLALGEPVACSALLLPLCVAPLLNMWRAKRIAALEDQLDGWLSALASVLKATPALGDAIEYSLNLSVSPLREELDTLVKEQRLGTPLDEALGRLGRRVDSRTLQSALGVLRIARQTGGDISKILERSAATLREMARLESVIRVKTAQGRAEGWVLGLLPAPVVTVIHQMNPGFLRPLVDTPRGQLVIACALSSWLASVILIRRILRVDI